MEQRMITQQEKTAKEMRAEEKVRRAQAELAKISREKMYSEDLVYTEVLLPENAPKEYKDPAVLWNSVEMYEKRSDAQLARTYRFELPNEWPYDLAKEVEQNVGKIGRDGHTWKQALLVSAKYNIRHKEYLLNLFKHTSGIYSFEQYMTDVNVSFISEYLKKGSVQIEEDLMRVLESYCYGAVKITIDRLTGKYDALPEDMARIYELSVPVANCQ